jgi:hypothetical protein
LTDTSFASTSEVSKFAVLEWSKLRDQKLWHVLPISSETWKLREHLLSRKCFTVNEELAHKEINCVHTSELRNIEIYLHEITCIRTAELRFYRERVDPQ